jgi:apolipoprotein N-acyltransferase
MSSPWARIGRYLAALAAGIAMALAFAPFNLSWLAVAGLTVIFYLIATSRPRDVWGLGYVFGLGYAGLGVYWIFVSISRYGGGLVPASLATPVFVALFALLPMLALWLGRWLGRDRVSWSTALTLPLAWVAVEWVRSWLFTGATWLAVGYSQIDQAVAALAPVTGLFGISLMVALLAGALAACAVNPVRLRMAWLAVVVVVYFGSGALERIQWTQPDGEPLAFAMVQGNVPPDQKWQAAERRETLRYYTARTREHLGKPLVIWPETAVPAFYRRVRDGWLAPLAAEADAAGTDVITGIPRVDDQRNLYNAVMVLGQPERAYRKRHLVPFGEYVPFRGWLGGVLDFVGAPLGDITPGDEATLLAAAGVRIGVSVCYEVTFGDEVADTVPEAGLLLNVSNDGWFGDSSAPYQHLQIARMRSVETGRAMLRSTNTGITAVIGADGRVRQRAPMFQRAVLSGQVQPRTGATPYSRWEDWPVVAIILAGLGAAAVGARVSARRT